jgi:hypothetical protein
MKKYFLILTVFSFLCLIPASALATSGACSYHGGVNCSVGANYSGKVQCNDGWINSSVNFSDTNECKLQNSYPCTTESDYARLQADLLKSGSLQYTASANGILQACRSSINSSQPIYNNTPIILPDKNTYINTHMQEYCVTNHGLQSNWNATTQNCGCNSGYTKMTVGISYQCVSDQEISDTQTNYCHKQFGENSYHNPNSVTCYCSPGYFFDKFKNACIFDDEVNANLYCKEQYGELAEMTTGNKNSCSCPSGYEFNSAKTCEKVSSITTPDPQKLKKVIKSSIVTPLEIEKDSIKNNKTNTSIQPENTTVSTNSAPIKKLKWYKKIFNWFR